MLQQHHHYFYSSYSNVRPHSSYRQYNHTAVTPLLLCFLLVLRVLPAGLPPFSHNSPVYIYEKRLLAWLQYPLHTTTIGRSSICHQFGVSICCVTSPLHLDGHVRNVSYHAMIILLQYCCLLLYALLCTFVRSIDRAIICVDLDCCVLQERTPLVWVCLWHQVERCTAASAAAVNEKTSTRLSTND